LEQHNYSQIHLEIPQNHISFVTEFITLDSYYLIVDSTFKSNRENFELFAIILLYEGEGYPASYLYLQRNAAEGERKRAIELWYIISVIARFNKVKDFGVVPTFIKMDKDIGQIGAAITVWPNSTINLCLWHILRAIKKRLGDPKKVSLII
jgi:hypothetical protein